MEKLASYTIGVFTPYNMHENNSVPHFSLLKQSFVQYFLLICFFEKDTKKPRISTGAFPIPKFHLGVILSFTSDYFFLLDLLLQ